MVKNWSHFYILYFFFSFPSENLFAMLELSKLDLAFLTREMHKVISNELSFFSEQCILFGQIMNVKN